MEAIKQAGVYQAVLPNKSLFNQIASNGVFTQAERTAWESRIAQAAKSGKLDVAQQNKPSA